MNPLDLATRTYSEFSDDDCMTQGAALAYYTVFSLAPLLLMVISIAGIILGRQTVQQQFRHR
jgi:membrane protein